MMKKFVLVACSLCFFTVNAGNPVSFWGEKEKARVAALREHQVQEVGASCLLAFGGFCALVCCADRYCRDQAIEGARACCGNDVAQNCATALNVARHARIGLQDRLARLRAPQPQQMHRD